MTPEEIAAYEALDTDKDGVISSDEFAASLALWKRRTFENCF